MPQINVEELITFRVKEELERHDRYLDTSRIISLETIEKQIYVHDDGIISDPALTVSDTFRNCNNTSEKRGWIEKLTLTKKVKTSKKVTYQNEITTGISVEVTAKVPMLGKGSGSKVTANWSMKTTNTREHYIEEEVTQVNSRDINIEVKPYSVLEVTLHKLVYSVSIPITVRMVFDGTMEAKYRIGRRGSKTTESFKISDMLSLDNRVVYNKGVLENNSASVLDVSYFERAFDPEKDADHCNGQSYRLF